MIKTIFRLPWFVFLIFALISLAVGAYSYQQTKTMNAHKVAALAGGLPEIIDASLVNKSSFSAADEIYLSSQVSEQIYTVSVSGRRTVDKSKTTIFALSANETSPTGTINAVYMFDPHHDVDKFFSMFATENGGELSVILNVNGAAYDPGRKLKKSVRNAATQAGLTLSSDVVFIEPFFNGRERGLATEPPIIYFAVFAGIAGILALISVIKLLLGARRKKKLTAAALEHPQPVNQNA